LFYPRQVSPFGVAAAPQLGRSVGSANLSGNCGRCRAIRKRNRAKLGTIVDRPF
jgi:hypothetical protein